MQSNPSHCCAGFREEETENSKSLSLLAYMVEKLSGGKNITFFPVPLNISLFFSN